MKSGMHTKTDNIFWQKWVMSYNTKNFEAYHILLKVKALVSQTKLQHAASTLSSQI